MTELLPAIDLRGGHAVRLRQGDFAREDDFGDPLELARAYEAAGARWIHVVDLDAARTGDPVNRAVIAAIAAEVGLSVEVGGGIRTDADVAAMAEIGVARVVLGTAALERPRWAHDVIRSGPVPVALGVDYRVAGGRREVAIRGWEAGSGRDLDDVVAEFAPSRPAALVATSIDRDGMMGGPDLDGLAHLLATTGVAVVASGGVASVADVAALAALTAGPERRLAGVITGRAVVEGRLSVEEGVAACAASG